MAENGATRARVMVVQADPGYRGQIAAHLMKAGHAVLPVAGEAEARGQAETFRPTVLIADHSPSGDARSLVADLRTQGREGMPVVLLGDPDHSREIEAVLALGNVTYLRRGAAWDKFDRTMATVVARQVVTAPTPAHAPDDAVGMGL